MKYWREVLIGILILLCGVFITLYVNSPSTKSYKSSIDSLQKVNAALNLKAKHISDSLNTLIQAREDSNSFLDIKLSAITDKYLALKNKTPIHDTVIEIHKVFEGQECMDKMPIIQAECFNLRTENYQIRKLVKVKDDQILHLEGQYERSTEITLAQEKQIKKLDRQRKWNKVWGITTSVSTAAAVAALITVIALK